MDTETLLARSTRPAGPRFPAPCLRRVCGSGKKPFSSRRRRIRSASPLSGGPWALLSVPCLPLRRPCSCCGAPPGLGWSLQFEGVRRSDPTRRTGSVGATDKLGAGQYAYRRSSVRS